MNPMDLKRGAQLAVDKVVTVLESISKTITTKEEIAQVGTISANGERTIGDLLADAMEKVGKEGVITVQDGKTMHNELDVVEGMRFDRGYISPYFVTDNKAQTVEFENPLILLVEKKISTLQSILPVLESAVKSQRPLLIISEDVESEALATLVINKLRGGIKVCAVKAPGFGDNRKATLQDIAVITGGQVTHSPTSPSAATNLSTPNSIMHMPPQYVPATSTSPMYLSENFILALEMSVPSFQSLAQVCHPHHELLTIPQFLLLLCLCHPMMPP